MLVFWHNRQIDWHIYLLLHTYIFHFVLGTHVCFTFAISFRILSSELLEIHDAAKITQKYKHSFFRLFVKFWCVKSQQNASRFVFFAITSVIHPLIHPSIHPTHLYYYNFIEILYVMNKSCMIVSLWLAATATTVAVIVFMRACRWFYSFLFL